VTDRPLAGWHELCSDFKKVASKIGSLASVNLNSAALRSEIKAVARQYMQEGRRVLSRQGFEEDLDALNEPFTKLYELAEGQNAVASYKRHVGTIRKALPRITSRLEMESASGDAPAHSDVELQVIQTLAGLVPTAELSYRQVIRDLADSTRVSYRGPAAELREVLREVCDHLAPDADVMNSSGYKPEKDQHGKDRTRPTMKQQVRFILKARGQSASSTELPEKAVEAVDALVGSIARSVYNFGSVVTHVAGERQSVVNLKRWVETVLTHLLEL
jgi:hypothetical protein